MRRATTIELLEGVGAAGGVYGEGLYGSGTYGQPPEPPGQVPSYRLVALPLDQTEDDIG